MELEKKVVEDWVIEKLKGSGWKYIEPGKLERTGFDEPLLTGILEKKIREINEDVELVDEDINLVINKLKSAFVDQNGHKEILKYFKYGIPIKTEKEKVVRYIQIFDYKNIDKNEFFFTNQFEFIGKEKIRLDILLFVNGIPLVNIECKNPYTNKTNYYDAYKQIKRYEKLAPELYKYIQIGIGYAERIKYFPIVPWLEEVKQEIWRWEDRNEEEAIFKMLSPNFLLDIIKNFIFVREFRGEMTKVIGRYMQFRATNKIYQRVIDNLSGKTGKNKGLIWHWQGSGKTLTMIFSAHKLYFELGKPTIIFIVDRKDLERQFFDELSSLDLNFNFEKIESIEHLKEILTYDDYRGKRGVFLTLIHKFNLKEEFILEEIKKYKEITERKDIICFLDEVHRTQYGILALKMGSILENGFFFGFTGTPISYKDRDTYKKFGYIDENEFYLDKYFIDEAEKDGFVVPIIYELRKEEVNLKDMDLEWYFEQIEIEDIVDIETEEIIRKDVERRINEITAILESRKNIEVICEDISKHYKANFDGKFKGLIVTGSRVACVRFKSILDKYLPAEYSEIVMTFDRENEEINEYKRNLVERFKINDVDEIVKKIIEKFQKEEYPKLLIVTDMLITGFDEPKLAVLYLYKILKNHRLLQTMARVNRPYYEKPAGLLVDYVGVFKYIKRAFKAYSDKDLETIVNKITDMKKAEDRFKEIIINLENMFGNLVSNFKKETFDEALEILRKKEDKFVQLYKELRMWFEFLKADWKEILQYLEKYKWFSCLYEYYKKLMKPDIDETKVEKYFKETIELIHELIEPSGLKKIEPRAIDLNYIKNLKKSNLTEKQKTIGILNALVHICTLTSKNPIYKSIAEKVRELVEKWKEEEIDIFAISASIDEILDYIDKKEKEKEETNLSGIEFGIKIILENKINVEKMVIEEIARELYKEIKDNLYENWTQNPAKVKEVERKIRFFLAGIKIKYNIPDDEYEKLHKEIFEFVKEYEPEK